MGRYAKPFPFMKGLYPYGCGGIISFKGDGSYEDRGYESAFSCSL